MRRFIQMLIGLALGVAMCVGILVCVSDAWAVTYYVNKKSDMPLPEYKWQYEISEVTASRQVYLFGGSNATATPTYTNAIRRYDIATNTWQTLSLTLPYAYTDNISHGVAQASNGKFYLSPGNGAGGWGTHNKIIEIDVNAGTALERAAITSGNIWEVSVIPAPSSKGGVYLLGGWNGSGDAAIRHYNPTTDTITTVANLTSARIVGARALHPNGKVYIFGANYNLNMVVEKFDTATETLSAIPNPGGLIFNYSTKCWVGSDNKIYLINSTGSGALGASSGKAFVFDPTSETFADLGIPTFTGDIASGSGWGNLGLAVVRDATTNTLLLFSHVSQSAGNVIADVSELSTNSLPLQTGSLSLLPTATTFAATISGTLSAPTTFTLSNSGTAAVTVSAIDLSGTNSNQFSVAIGGTTPCASLTPTIAIGGSCTVSVTFTPTSIGSKSANLQVTSTATNSPALASVSGSGNPIEYSIGSAVTGSGGTISCATPVAQGAQSVCTIFPTAGYSLATLTDNGTNVKSLVSGATYTISNLTAAHTVAGTFALIPIYGVCGSSHTAIFASFPTTNLCTTGTATAVTGNGPWNWNCNGNSTGGNTGCTSLLLSNSSISLPQTGQSICYVTGGTAIPCAGTGQDGEMQAGTVWTNANRFTDNSDQSITDNLTGLIWAKDANTPGPTACLPAANKTWKGALDYVACLNTNNYLTKNDWRLPNTTEMESLINIGSVSPVNWLKLHGFTNVNSNIGYWTSSSSITAPASAWYVVLDGWGNVSITAKSDTNPIWPVRSAPSGSKLPKTGQTTCYDPTTNAEITCNAATTAGQDGLLQAGVAWSSPRFTDNSTATPTDLTITDNLTGLTWTKNANVMKTRNASFDADGTAQDGAVTWQHALDYVKKLNAENYLGQRDWRLPNRTELESIINRGQANPATWLGPAGQGFTFVQNYYWSSSNSAWYNVNTWMANFSDGGVATNGMTNSQMFVWPVRGGTVSTSAFTIAATITAAPLNLSNQASGTISFSATSAATFQCSQDGGVYSTCSSPYSYSSLANGSHTFTVVATDSSNASNISSPASVTWKIDAALTSSVAVMIPRTGQATCYDTVTNSAKASCDAVTTGQDGNVRAGLAWPATRFTNNGNQTITDNLTGLIWTENSNVMAANNPGLDNDGTAGDGLVTWQHALDYVKNTLNAGTGYLGFTDWRLPNLNELASLSNKEPLRPLEWLHTLGLFSITDTEYWSGTSAVSTDSGSMAWTVALGGWVRTNIQSKSSMYAVWPVRSGASASLTLPRTGQTACYDAFDAPIACSGTGQDGELQTGVPWPLPRFQDNSLITSADPTITDKLTGLIWAKDANVMPTRNPGFDLDSADDGWVTWQHALDFVKKLNTENYLGHSDWRLPNSNELDSLVHREQRGYYTWLSGQGFTNIPFYGHWSSSTYALTADRAWGVDGDMGSKTGYGYVWPVRSGPTGSMSLFTLNPATTTTFPATAINTRSASVKCTLQNYGVSAVAVSKITTTGTDADQFSIAQGTCASLIPTLAAGASCTLDVTFKPTSAGAKSAALQVTSNDTFSPALTTALSGSVNVPQFPVGDIDGSNTFDISDVMLGLRAAVGLVTLTPEQILRGDVAPLVNNKPAPDGKVDLGDVGVLLRKLVGLYSW